MGTQFSVTYQSDSIDSEKVKQQIQAELNDINQLMSTYIADSEINRFNSLDNNQCFKFSDKTWQVLLAANDVYHQTNGAFDITLGPLISRWGFNAEEYQQKVPSSEEISQLLSQVGTDKLKFNFAQQCIQKSAPNISINLSAIAKGYAVDQISNLLSDLGISNYLVDIGGESKSLGVNPTGATWRIAIEKPIDLQRQQAVTVSLNNTSIATSGDYRNYFVANGKRFSHTIDPATGFPITHNLASISVIFPSNMYADAYATAMTVMGSKRALAFAQQQQIPVFIITRDGQKLSTQSNQWFDKYISQ